MEKEDGIDPPKINLKDIKEKGLEIDPLEDKVSRLEKKENYWDPKWVISIMIPLLLALIGGSYTIGKDYGYSRFDKEKITLESDNQNYLKQIDSLKGIIEFINMSKSLTKNELTKHLSDNLRFLESSSNFFDQGYLEEAKRLAVTIRVLVHDTINSTSILNLLELKDGSNFYDTSATYNPKNLFVEFSGLLLTNFNSNTGMSYSARLSESGGKSNPNKFIPFSDWWNAIIIRDSKGVTYTRKELVLILANKDGGAHVDPNISQDYKALRNADRTNWTSVKEGESEEILYPPKNIELHSIRQIAYELIVSINRMK